MLASNQIVKILASIWLLLTRSQRKGAIQLALLMLIGMGLETLSIGLLIPLLALLASPGNALPTARIVEAFANHGISGHEQVIVAALLFFLAIYLVKTIFLGFLAWRQASFVFGIETDISFRLFSIYMNQPYTFHLQRNSAQLLRNVTTDTGLVKETLYFGMQLVTELLILLGLTILLLFLEPLGLFLLGGTLAVAGLLYLRTTKKQVISWGQEQQYHQGMRIQHLQQGLASVKDAKILGREDEFAGRYFHHTYHALQAGRKQLTVQQYPRLWMEFIAMFALVTLILMMIYLGRTLEMILPTVGVFAAAAFRLMPSATRVVNAIQTLRYGLSAIDNLKAELGLSQAERQVRSKNDEMFGSKIEFEGVSYSYPGANGASLRNISLVIRKGETVGFIGASGAGKSTLVDILLGLLPPGSGKVLVDDWNIANNIGSWQSRIGYVPQTIFLTDDTLRHNVAFGLAGDQIDDEKVRRALRLAQLDGFVYGLPNALDTMVGERGVRLSGGQRQRIGIARALYHDPEVLVLDEATSALDTETEAGVMESVRALKGNKTVIIVAHRFSTVRECDRLFRLERGEILHHGTFDEVIAAA